MKKIIWKLRYTLHAWKRGMDWRTAWYCAGCSADDDALEPFTERDPIEDADTEISYALES